MIRSAMFCVRKALSCSIFFVLLLSFTALSQNPIVTENALPGNPISEWGVPDFRDNRIAGFATKMSLNRGQTVRFKINVQSAASYTLKIYRIGYYGGNGARLVANLGSFSGTIQPNGNYNASTGELDCGNWSESASWAIPSSAVSGFYVAKLERSGGGSNHIAFIVRNDASTSDLYVQFPDATWQAYNGYGGNSMYDGTTSWPAGHAVKVSYNRPFFPYNSLFNTDGREADWYMNAEYPMIRWLERNGYDVSYTSCNDVSKNGSRLLNHRVFVTLGHDEYWSKTHRQNVEAARDAGVHLAFFTGNEVYWKTRWEDNDGTEDRTLVCYKEGFLGDGTLGERTCGTKCDPSTEWTGLWRTGGNYDAGQPENSLVGQISWVENPAEIGVPVFYKNLRFWRNTSVANLSAGQTAFLGVNTLGYEWDYEQPQYGSSYPPGRITMSSRTVSGLTHKLSLYRHSSGALVFGAGTVQWSWGLDGQHWGGGSTISPEMQQATVNLFADMGVQPGTLQAGLTPASQSSDFTAPTATITSPSNGSSFSSGATITFSGNASDGGGGVVASVEVSVDGGSTWTPATINSIASTTSWSYTWTAGPNGTYNIRSRGVDDSGNKSATGSGITITVGGAGDLTPPSVSSVSPTNGSTGVSVNTTITANFSEAISSASVSTSTYQLRDGSNNLVSASINTSGSQITLSPTSPLNASTSYTATITGGSAGVKDLAGNALVSNFSWSFTTGAASGSSVTLFAPSSAPAELANDGQGISLGMRFRTTQNGFITGIRYYKGAGTTGTHTGHLWTNAGSQLAQVTFTNETPSGWQQVFFSSPVAVTAGITYVASYFSPSGDYCATKPFFTQAIVNGPLRGLADGEDGPNGIYRYTATPAFPNSSFQSSNYWVDVVFTPSGGGSSPTITLQPSSQTVCSGNNVSFTSAASGSPTPSVQWQESTNGTTWTNVSGATNSTLSVSATTALNNRRYRAVWTNSSGSVNSNSATLTVNAIPAAPSVSVVNNCGSSTLTASSFSGSLLWSTGATSTSITVTTAGTYTVTQTVNGCTSPTGQGTAAPINSNVQAPTVSVVNNCGNSTLTAGSFTGSLLWSTGATSTSITVTTGGTYTVRQTVNGCTSPAGSGIAAPKPIPALSSSLSGTATSGVSYTYVPSSTVSGTSFSWTRAAVSGISNSAANGTGSITETLNNTTSSPVNVTYVYTLTANGCTNTQNVVVTVNPAPVANCMINNSSLTSNFNGTAIPAGRYIWFNSSLDPGSLGTGTDPVTMYITNGVIRFTANNVQYNLSVPNARIRFDASVTSASTQFINNVWETVVPRSYSSDVFMGGLAYLVPVNFPGNFMNVNWTTNISIDKPGISIGWRWAAAVYTSFADHSGINVKPINGSTQNPYPNLDRAGTPENFKSFVVDGAKGTGGTNYTGSFTIINTATCSDSPQAPSAPTVTVVNNCGNSVLTAGSFTGSLLWSNGATTPSITVTEGGTYTVTQTVNGITSAPGSGTAAPINSNVPTPTVSVVNNCGSSTLTAGSFTGSLLWNTGATTSSITVTAAGTYTVTQTVNGCTSSPGSGVAAPVNGNVPAPTVTVDNNCGSSTLTAGSFTGSLLWSTGATTASITVTTAGTYTVTQTVNGCTSSPGSAVAAPVNSNVPAPTVTVVNNCGSSTLTAGSFTGSLLWSTGATTASITVTTAGTYTVTQTVNGCTSSPGSGTAAPVNSNVAAPTVTVTNNCNNSVLTAGSFTGSLLWSTGATTASITVTTGGTYTVTQTVNGCTSAPGSGIAAPINSSLPAPTVTVTNNCNNSVLTAGSFTGSLLWSTGATTASITVTTGGTYTVTQTLNGCTSQAGSGTAAPKPTPVLSSNLSATATSGTAFTYTPASTVAGTTFTWTRAEVAGISNAAGSGTGAISETLTNTTSSPVAVTYVYTLTANGCTNTQTVVVTVNLPVPVNCTINGSSESANFNSTSIPAGRYIWFNSSLNPSSFGSGTSTVTMDITSTVITFTASGQSYQLNVPDGRIRFDATVTSASTQFVNGRWETVVPRSFSNHVFMNGLAYQVPVNFPGSISNVTWTTNVKINRANTTINWRWSAAVYTTFAAHSGINVKPISSSSQNPYPNSDAAGTPENFKSSLVGGARGNGGSNYTGNFSNSGGITCSTVGTREAGEPIITMQALDDQIKDVPTKGIRQTRMLEAQVMPNPSSTYFNLAVKGSNELPVTIKIMDIFGRVVEKHERIAANTVLKIGSKWTNGSYYAEVIQGDQRKIIKILKAR